MNERTSHPHIGSSVAQRVLVRDIQSTFAEDIEEQGLHAIPMLRECIQKAQGGRLHPVLLWGTLESESGGPNSDGFPYAVFFPNRELRERVEVNDAGALVLEEESKFAKDYLDAGNPAGSIIEISPDNIVSGDLPLLTVLTQEGIKFGAYDALLVVDGHGFSGVVSAEDLESVPARVALAAFVLELESWALELCHLFPLECFTSLPLSRREAAQNRVKDQNRSKKQKPDELMLRRVATAHRRANNLVAAVVSPLLDATSLVDKGRMLRKCKLTIELSGSELNSLFARADRLRNWSLHPSEMPLSEVFELKELRPFLQNVARVTESLKESFEREWRARRAQPPSKEAPSP